MDHLREPGDRIAQARAINASFSTNRYPTILAGDLNAQPGSEAIQILESFWNATYDHQNPQPTFPSDNPRIKIDYIMTSPNAKWRVLERVSIADKEGSDHCAYLVILELLGGTP